MAQAQIAIDTTRRRPSVLAALALRWIAFREHARNRREANRMLAKILAERELGRATGARV